MLNPSQKRIFAACPKAILHLHAVGVDNANQAEAEALMNATSLLFDAIHEMTGAKRASYKSGWVQTILEHMHPDTDYSFLPAVVRDAADVALTIARLGSGKHRSDPTKVLDAQLFCDMAGNGVHK